MTDPVLGDNQSEDAAETPIEEKGDDIAAEANAAKAEEPVKQPSERRGDSRERQAGKTTRRNKKQKKPSSTCLVVLVVGGFILFGFAILFFFMVIGISLLGDMPELSTASQSASAVHFTEELIMGKRYSENKIAVIDVEGVIMQGNSAVYQVANASLINEQIKYARSQPGVKGVIIKLNTPGGEVVASDIIHHQIMKLKEERGIPVVASMGSMAASGGYYIAVACDEIVANRLTTTGSIGVIIQSYSYYDLLAKIGVDTNVYKSGAMKDILSGTRPVTPAENQVLQELVDETYNEFVSLVAQGRKTLTVDKIKNSTIGDGRVLSGKQALRLGLVDQLGFFEDAVKVVAKKANLGEDYQVIRYQKTFTFSQLFLGGKASPASRDKKVSVKLPGTDNWTSLLEPGKMYFLPAF